MVIEKRVTFHSKKGTVYSIVHSFDEETVLENGVYLPPFLYKGKESPVYGLYECYIQDDEFPIQFYHDGGINRITVSEIDSIFINYEKGRSIQKQ